MLSNFKSKKILIIKNRKINSIKMSDNLEWDNENYLEKKVRCLIEPLLTSVLVERPNEPVSLIDLI